LRSLSSTAWLIAVVLVSASGASCPTRQPPGPTAPAAFLAPPNVGDVLSVVNANSARIQQLQADNVRFSVQGIPTMRASVALQRPRSFRLRAQFVGLGEVLDLGSNQELFWALIDAPQMATNVPRGIYYARHDQYASARVDFLPVRPDWLVDAFGLPILDPSHVHEGPWQRGGDQLEIRSRIPTWEGETGRITIIHASFGWVLEQHVYDPRGQWVASSLTSNHRYYPEIGVSLPHRIEIRLPPPNRPFHLEVDTYSINQLRVDPSQLFAMPDYPGYPRIDLAAPGMMLPPGSLPPQPPAVPPPYSPSAEPYPTTGMRPRYRGYSSSHY
jgi:hypothetical protein